MSNQPQFVTLIDIECISTDNSSDDELIGRFEDLQATDFPIGRFDSKPGNKVALNIEKIVPVGVTTVKIIEKDLISNDDLIGTVDLTENMSVENEVTLRNDSAVISCITWLLKAIEQKMPVQAFDNNYYPHEYHQ